MNEATNAKLFSANLSLLTSTRKVSTVSISQVLYSRSYLLRAIHRASNGSPKTLSNSQSTTRHPPGLSHKGMYTNDNPSKVLNTDRSSQARTKDLDQIQLIDLDPKVSRSTPSPALSPRPLPYGASGPWSQIN